VRFCRTCFAEQKGSIQYECCLFAAFIHINYVLIKIEKEKTTRQNAKQIKCMYILNKNNTTTHEVIKQKPPYT
jgi:hypothetical protein